MAEQNLNSEKDIDQTKSQSSFRGEAVSVILLVLILLLAAYLRFTGINWDQGTHIHPDERFLTSVGTRLEPASGLLNYLKTSESPLNPYNVKNGENKAFPLFVYGNFPMTVTRVTAVSANNLCALFPNTQFTLCDNNFTAYDGIHLYGRFLSALVDLIGVAFLFLIGRRLYGLKVALLGTFLLATAVMPIQQSHFFTMDNWAAALTTMALYAAVRVSTLGDETPRWQPVWYALFGGALGLAVSSRINVAPLAGIIIIAAAIYLTRIDSRFSIPNFQFPISRHWQRAIVGILLAALISIITFRLAQPYAFADSALRQEQIAHADPNTGFLIRTVSSIVGFNQDWLNNMAEIQRLQAPEASFPPANQWVSRPPIIFPFSNMVLYGMGLGAGLMAFIGLGWALWRIARFRPDWTTHAIPAVWSAMYFLFMGTRWVKSIRYFLPIYPTLLLLAAWALFALWERAKQADRQRVLKQTAVSFLILLVPLSSFLWANSFVKIYQTPVTRLAATDWMFENVPSGATLLYSVDGVAKEHQLPLKGFDFVAGGIPLTLNFNIPEAGTLSGVRFNYLTDPDFNETGADGGETIRLRFNGEEVGETSLNLDDQRQSILISLPETAVSPDQPLQLITELTSEAPVRAGTSILVNEHWDDPLPIGTNGRNAFGSYYSGDTQPVTHPDNPEKQQQVIAWLDESDYVILSSQRALWSLPRLPLKYPLMMRYYEALFSGELGFKLVHQNQADLHIGPLYISDTSGQLGWGQPPVEGWPPPGALAAEEAFSVYDHPPVWIFAKTDSYSHANTLQILGSVNLDQFVNSNPLTATQAPNGLLLPRNVQAVQQANGTFSQIFDIDGLLSQNPALAAIVWWATAVILGWLAFPITFIALRGLPDKGYALSRILSLLLVSYFAWLMGSLNLLPYTRSTILAGVGLLAIINLGLFLRYRKEMWGFLRGNGRYILTVELIGILLYLLQIGIRLGNPDVWDIIWGGEKPMDLSYFTAVLKSTTFPPYDPWFAGGYINYYYYGFVYVGTLTKLLGIIPTLAYNLILPMLYSFTGLGVFSIAYNLVVFRDWRLAIGDSDGTHNPQSPISSRKALKAGLLAITLAIVLGNLGELGVIINAWMKAGSAQLGNLPLIGGLAQFLDGGLKILSGQPAPIYPGDWFWTATRAINANPGEVQPITEFPFFTYLYGDLHAHMISMPLQMLALGWAVGMGLEIRDWKLNTRRTISNLQSLIPSFLRLLVGGLAIGVLRATNTWDWPTYLVIGGLAVVFHAYQQDRRFSLSTLLRAGLQVGLLFGLATITFWPFAANYGVGYTTASLWPGSYTHLGNYLVVYGLFLFFIFTHLAREFRTWTRTWTQAGLQQFESFALPLILALLLYIIVLLLLVLKGYLIAPLVVSLILVAGLLALRRDIDPARRIILILIACALGLTLIVEFVVLDGDIGRMNTVFKFYMQVWLILSVVGGVVAVWAIPSLKTRPATRRVWRIALTMLIGTAALYPILATRAKWQIRMSKDAPNTLNGSAFMPFVEYGDTNYAGQSTTIRLADDFDAIQWMQRNIEGSPVVAEAHSGNPYRSIGNRVAMYTGLPAIVGWDWHQRQQRAVVPGSMVTSRIEDVKTLYNTPEIEQAVSILGKYDVGYIYLGELERTYYFPQGIEKFDQMVNEGILEVVYEDTAVTIYRVR